MNRLAAAANLAWIGSSLPEWRRFRAALNDPRPAQAAVLAGIVTLNARSRLGHELGFASMLRASRRAVDPALELVDRYRARVPLSKYEYVEPHIHRIRAGEQNVLTSSIVRYLVPSSGTTSAAKLLPFTRDLQRDFSRALNPWIADLHLSHPAAIRGRSYWSISPAVPRDCRSAVAVGFADDTEYLGKAGRALARAVFVVPNDVSRVFDPEAFRYITLTFLLGARDLRLVSVWHPSFLTRLLEPLAEWRARIAADVEHGTLRPPGSVDGDLLSALRRRMRPDPQRARELQSLASLEPRDVWPMLAVISCWTDGPAGPFAEHLRRAVPGVGIQGKGLIATEGIVSIPFGGQRPLAIRSHFLEFLDSAGRAHLAHELQRGREYSVVLTTSAGLYRYRLGDRVVVDGAVSRTPSIAFVGKDDRMSDRYGEKLSEGFVAGVLQRLFADEPAPLFAMLAPTHVEGGVAYTLFLEGTRADDHLAARLERELRRNVHYAWCVDLRQLRPARIARVGPDASRLYVDACVARGQRLGDVKPAALDCDTDWREVLVGRQL